MAEKVRFSRSLTCYTCTTRWKHLTDYSFPTVKDPDVPPDERDRWSQCRNCLNGRHQTVCTLEHFGFVTDADVDETDDDDDIGNFQNEGKQAYRKHKVRERKPKVRADKLAEVIQKFGRPICESCDVEIEPLYGTPHGRVYECHHLVPLHASGEVQTVPSDVVLLCPTCHRAAHWTKPWPTLDEMRALHHS
jgi:predicted HNH restriction endonuclease